MSDPEDDDKSPKRKAAKKVYYPFGTPSHAHHAYSEFAHMNVDTRNFAMELATATDIKPQIVEEKPKKRRPAPVIKKKVVDEEGSGGEQSINSEEQPCTKIACQMVVRALADMEYKNQIEKMDLEDAYETHLQEMQQLEQDLGHSEAKLHKLTDIGNQLEDSSSKLLRKVEEMEKFMDGLSTERAEINTKLMLLEVEKQKWNRKLEKAQKALSDARWKRKKAAMDAIMDGGDGGISTSPSVIADGPIIKCDESVVSAANEVFNTTYSRLVQGRAIDRSELPPTLKSIPFTVQETFFKHPEKLDKYSKAHYRKAVTHSIESWEAQAGSILACSIKAADDALAAHEQDLLKESLVESRRLNRLAKLQSSISTQSLTLSTASPSASHVSAAVSSRVGSHLLSRSGHRSLSGSGGSVHREHDDSSTMSRSQSLVRSVQSLYERANQGGLLPPNTRTATNLKLRSMLSSPSKASIAGSPPRDNQSVLSPGETSLDASISVLSVEEEEAYVEKLAESGIYVDPNGRRVVKTRLDKVFYKDPARVSYGRTVPKGKTIVKPGKVLEVKKDPIPEDTDAVVQKMLRKNGMNKFSSNGSFDLRTIPRLTSQVLTTKHPGMNAFSYAATMSMMKDSEKK